MSASTGHLTPGQVEEVRAIVREVLADAPVIVRPSIRLDRARLLRAVGEALVSARHGLEPREGQDELGEQLPGVDLVGAGAGIEGAYEGSGDREVLGQVGRSRDQVEHDDSSSVAPDAGTSGGPPTVEAPGDAPRFDSSTRRVTDELPAGLVAPGQAGGYSTGPSITCPRCHMTSYSPDDVEHGYCGHCHDWTSPPGDR